MDDVIQDNKRWLEELKDMDQNGNQLMDNVARVNQCHSFTRNKSWCHESLSGRDLKNPLKRKEYLSDAPLNYYRYLLLEMHETHCAKELARLRSWIFPMHFMTYLEKESQTGFRSYSSKVPGKCKSFE